MRLIGSFHTITIQGTSGSATSSVSGARSRTGAVVLMLLMAPMVANPCRERKGRRIQISMWSCEPALVPRAEGDAGAVEVLQQGYGGLAGGAGRAFCLPPPERAPP